MLPSADIGFGKGNNSNAYNSAGRRVTSLPTQPPSTLNSCLPPPTASMNPWAMLTPANTTPRTPRASQQQQVQSTFATMPPEQMSIYNQSRNSKNAHLMQQYATASSSSTANNNNNNTTTTTIRSPLLKLSVKLVDTYVAINKVFSIIFDYFLLFSSALLRIKEAKQGGIIGVLASCFNRATVNSYE